MKRKLKDDRNVFVGAMVPIYMDYRNKERFEGFAKLLKKESKIGLTFFADNEKVSEDWHPAIYISERWLVEFTTWQKTTFRTHRWIRKLIRPATKIRQGGDSVMSLYTTYDHKIEKEDPEDKWENDI